MRGLHLPFACGPTLIPACPPPWPQADDGWKCVYYRGQPLADFRAAFERQVPAPGAAGGGAAGAAAATAALAPTRTSGRQRKKKRFDSDSEGEAYAGDALTDEAYAMFLSAAEHQARQAQQAQQARQAQQAAQQAQQEVIVELPAGVEVSGSVGALLSSSQQRMHCSFGRPTCAHGILMRCVVEVPTPPITSSLLSRCPTLTAGCSATAARSGALCRQRTGRRCRTTRGKNGSGESVGWAGIVGCWSGNCGVAVQAGLLRKGRGPLGLYASWRLPKLATVQP